MRVVCESMKKANMEKRKAVYRTGGYWPERGICFVAGSLRCGRTAAHLAPRIWGARAGRMIRLQLNIPPALRSRHLR